MAKQQLPHTIEYALVTQVILLRPKAETTDEALLTFFKGSAYLNLLSVR